MSENSAAAAAVTETPMAPTAAPAPAAAVAAAPTAPAVPAGPTPEEIRAELAAEFAAKLKAATGADSLEELEAERKAAADAELAKQGEYQKLAEQALAEAGAYKARFEAAQIQAAIAAAATGSVDPETVSALLSPAATVGADGTVTIGGKPAAEAVSALLTAKPHLARPASSGTGSGSPGAAAPAKPASAPKRADFNDDVAYHRARAQWSAAQGA
jgi:hypothetical protein